jgi:hypothetical protein
MSGNTADPESDLFLRFSRIPAIPAVINADSGRAMVIMGPIRAYVNAMESTPDSGVDIRKDTVAPLLAPCFLRVAAAGRTPQEQRGMGIPISEAFNTEMYRPFPRCRDTSPGGRKALRRPATPIPNRINTDDSFKKYSASRNT